MTQFSNTSERVGDAEVALTPLGGLGRIGLNAMLLTTDSEEFVIDCGVQFPGPSEPGVDYVLPDLDVLAERRPTAYIITHGHEDHIGGLPWALKVANAPVYGTAFTLGLIRRKLIEHGIDKTVELNEISPDKGCGFATTRFEFVRVTHSIPDCVSAVARTPVGIVLHTGDWKIDRDPVDGQHFDHDRFKALGDEGVHLMMSDSTNAEVPGWSRGEADVGRGLLEQIDGWPGRVFVAMFSSNLHRFRLLADVARQTGRRLCALGRSLHNYLAIARDVGIPVPHADELVDISRIENIPDDEVLVVMTGSQAESRSALFRASIGQNRFVRIRPGDRIVLSARLIPGNERAIYEMITNLSRRGAQVVHPKAAPIHASGHAYRDELAHLIKLVRPRFFMPLHGEYPFLQRQARLATELGAERVRVIENGQSVVLRPDDFEMGEGVRLETQYVDGTQVGRRDDLNLIDRTRMGHQGAVALRVEITSSGSEIAASVSAVSSGLATEGGKLERGVERAVEEGLAKLPTFAPYGDLKEAVEVLGRRFYKKSSGKKPAVLVFLDDLRKGR